MIHKALSWLGLRAEPVLGLDVSSSSIKLLAMEPRGQGWQITHYSVVPMPAGAMRDKEVIEIDAVAAALQKAHEAGGFGLKKVAAALPTSSTIITTLQVPRGLSGDELEAQVLLDVPQYIPYALDEVYCDYVLLPSQSSGEQQNVALAVARKEPVDRLVQAILKADLEPVVIDVEAYALERACSGLMHESMKDAKHPVVVVDVGATQTTMTVIHQGRMIYNRTENFGGRLLTEQIEKHYQISTEEAGALKKQKEERDDYDTLLLRPFLLSLAQEVERLLAFFYSASAHEHIEKIILAGATVKLKDACAVVASTTSMVVEQAKPFSQITVTSAIRDSIEKDEPSLLVAAGLSMRGTL